jgi:hypothetical protein
MGETITRGISVPPGTVLGYRKNGAPIYPIAGGDGTGGEGDGNALTLTHPQAVNRLRDLDAEIGRLADLDNPTEDEEKRFNEAVAEFNTVDEWRRR